MAIFVYCKPHPPSSLEENSEKRQGNNKPGMLPYCCSSRLILLPVDQLNHRYDNPYSQSPSTTVNLFFVSLPPPPLSMDQNGALKSHTNTTELVQFLGERPYLPTNTVYLFLKLFENWIMYSLYNEFN